LQIGDRADGYCYYKISCELVESCSMGSICYGEIGFQIEQLAYKELVIDVPYAKKTKNFELILDFQLYQK